MRGRFSIIVFVGAMVVVLVALNAASYVRVEREAELEISPDRSTLNAGASGTRALYEFLEGSGHRLVRWRESPAALLKQTGNARPSTFVVVGATRIGFKEEDVKSLTEWVEAGGRLVVIDRAPEDALLAGDEWRMETNTITLPETDVRADDADKLTAGAPPLAPIQPTLLTRDVERVAPSRYASRFYASRVVKDAPESATAGASVTPESMPMIPANENGSPVIVRPKSSPKNANDESDATEDEYEPPPPPKPAPTGAPPVMPSHRGIGTSTPVASSSPQGNTIPYGDPRTAASPGEAEATTDDEAGDAPVWGAPVVHLSDERGALLADFARGKGRVVVLGDPFIVANRGISRADNLQLAANIITDAGGLIAFDEYHQGRGATHNQLAAYFKGTPVLAMCAQLFLLALAVVWTRGRRFARPLPAPRVDRRSKLEFVASMAELQQRARAFDLAIENVYGRTRRALARYGGTDSSAPRSVVAEQVAARSGRSKEEIESLMRECEDAISGSPVTARQSLALVARLRELAPA
ncbi:MAG TPA: DUF4350 domain-containing protein, partial [Pyrinomonadaceae bacterium]|nr:DUF4350 domain-containing protein [Pyrinomonadaceae bacterium]